MIQISVELAVQTRNELNGALAAHLAAHGQTRDWPKRKAQELRDLIGIWNKVIEEAATRTGGAAEDRRDAEGRP